MRFEKGDYLFEKGSKPREVFLNLAGDIRNMQTGRVFSTGQMIGQDDILFNQER